MNKTVKLGFAALAVAACASVYADEEEVEEVGAIGWTPVAVGLASPVQLPWGSARWDVFGLDLSLLWADAPKMYGLGIAGGAMATRDDLCGLQATAFCNWATKNVYGARLTLGANITYGESRSFEGGAFAYREGEFIGWDTELVGNYHTTDVWGVNVSGILNLTTTQSYGCMVAIGGNMAKVAYGCDIGGVFNFTDELHGAQIGLVNFARECPWGFQIGLVNVILDNKIKVLPFFNGYF